MDEGALQVVRVAQRGTARRDLEDAVVELERKYDITRDPDIAYALELIRRQR
jgi:hypothetical protein